MEALGHWWSGDSRRSGHSLPRDRSSQNRRFTVPFSSLRVGSRISNSAISPARGPQPGESNERNRRSLTMLPGPTPQRSDTPSHFRSHTQVLSHAANELEPRNPRSARPWRGDRSSGRINSQGSPVHDRSGHVVGRHTPDFSSSDNTLDSSYRLSLGVGPPTITEAGLNAASRSQRARDATSQTSNAISTTQVENAEAAVSTGEQLDSFFEDDSSESEAEIIAVIMIVRPRQRTI